MKVLKTIRSLPGVILANSDTQGNNLFLQVNISGYTINVP
jgi:hypothetical protein